MLLVWALYFQLLLNTQRRQRRAKILINRSGGHDLDARCIVSNMSAEPVYVHSVVMETDGKPSRISLTSLDTLAREPEGDPRRSWLQGPLRPGEYLTLGSFNSLLQAGGDSAPVVEDIASLSSFTILIVASYGPDDNPVAARRTFQCDSRRPQGSAWVAGRTRQLRGTTERRRLRKYLQDPAFRALSQAETRRASQ